jgi:hypothetical protein
MNKSFSLAAIMAASLCLPSLAVAAHCTATNSITRVSNSSSGAYEYVLFDLKTPTPTYHLSNKTPPFEFDPSGNIVSINGNKFKQIQFPSVYWMCTIPELLSLPKVQVKDVKRTGQFEGVVTYVVGYKTASKYLTTYWYPISTNRSKVVMKFKKN